MADVYLELQDDVVCSSKYIALPNLSTDVYVRKSEYYRSISSRIWIHIGSRIRLVHNIYGDTNWTTVDMKEFMLVKLKSKTI
jgi:hypothetical protein